MAKKPTKQDNKKRAAATRKTPGARIQVAAQPRDIDKELLEALSTPDLQKEAIAAFLALLKGRSERTVLWYMARFVGNPRTVDDDKQNKAASITFNFAGVQMAGPPVFDKPTAPSLQE